MKRPISTRRRSTDTVRQAERLSLSIAISLGQAVRTTRKTRGVTQYALAARAGVDQTRISQIERGLGRGVPLELWVAIGLALGRPLAVSFSAPLADLRGPVDAGHLAMQERLLELARVTGRTATFELPTRPADPRHSIDICVRDSRNRTFVIAEAWNTFADLGAAVRSTNRKIAEATAWPQRSMTLRPSESPRSGSSGQAPGTVGSWLDFPRSSDPLFLARLATGLPR